MNLIIKTRGNQPIDEKEKKWAEAKFVKLTKLCPPETVIEVTLEDLYGPKRGQDKKVHVLAEIPHAKEPFHLEEVDVKFRPAITRARDRFVRYMKRLKDKESVHHNRPSRKGLLGRFLARLRRQNHETAVGENPSD